MKALAIAFFLGLVVSQAKANTSIIQFDRLICSSDPHQAAAAETLSQDWPVLTPSTEPSLFTVWPPPHPESADYWLTLRFDGDGDTATGPLHRLTQRVRSLSSTRYAIRASHPANHPLDLDMAVYTAEAMLQAGGVAVEAENSSSLPPSPPVEAHDKLCRVAYLHLKATRGKAVSIPPQSPSTSSSWLMSLVERYYLGPLATFQPSGQPTPTPIHLTLDPLVAGVAPWSLTLGSPLFVPLLVVIVFWAGPTLARVLERRIDALISAHAKTD